MSPRPAKGRRRIENPRWSSARFVVGLATLAFGLAPARWLPADCLRFRDLLRRDYPNRADYERMEHGYYETLLDAAQKASALDGASAKHEGPGFEAGPLALVTDDLREYVLKPNISVKHFKSRWTTNSMGMRDKEYSATKPAGTFRIALIGDSIGAGWGVGDGEGFEPLLERRLSQASLERGGPAVEILNFAVPGHSPGQRWEHYERVSVGLGIDLVIYEATQADPGWDERRLRSVLHRRLINIAETPQFASVLTRIGVVPGDDPDVYKRLLKPYRWEILAEVYRTIAAGCRAQGAPCLWALIPRVGRDAEPGEGKRLSELARASGFTQVIDLSDAYGDADSADLAITRMDYHPNRKGHVLLEARLERALLDSPAIREIWRHKPTAGGGGGE